MFIKCSADNIIFYEEKISGKTCTVLYMKCINSKNESKLIKNGMDGGK